MFSYTARVNALKNPIGKIVGFASLVLDEVLEVQGFRIIEGSKGLFVSPPQHKGKGKDDEGNEVDTWYDDVRFLGENSEEIGKEIKQAILDSYLQKKGQNSRATAAQAQSSVNSDTNDEKKNRAPLW